MANTVHFLKLAAVMGRTGKSRSSIYSAIKSGDFPAPVRIGPRAIAWTSTAITEWQESRINASRKAV